MPTTVELVDSHPWAPIRDAVRLTQPDTDGLIELIRAELARIGDDELTQTVTQFIDRATDQQTLIRSLHKLRNRQ